jgi:hypothetical protein
LTRLARRLAGLSLILARLIRSLAGLVLSLAGLIRVLAGLIRSLAGLSLAGLSLTGLSLARLLLLILPGSRHCANKGASPSQRTGECQRSHGGNVHEIAPYRLHE